MKDWPQRKKNRLEGYDYSSVGVYFVTLCVKDRVPMLWDVGARIARPLEAPYTLSSYGRAVDKGIQDMSAHYPMISVDRYTIMPNHIHMLITIRGICAPTISNVINQFKGYVTKQIGFSCWQKSFHDHIVRNEEEYRKIWEYIESNPKNWKDDCFYIEIKENNP